MCEILDRIEARGVKLGFEQGIEQGIEIGRLQIQKEMAADLRQRGWSDEEIAEHLRSQSSTSKSGSIPKKANSRAPNLGAWDGALTSGANCSVSITKNGSSGGEPRASVFFNTAFGREERNQKFSEAPAKKPWKRRSSN